MLFLKTVNNIPTEILRVDITTNDYNYLYKVMHILKILDPRCDITVTNKTIINKCYKNFKEVNLTKEVKERLKEVL